jgi:hypothetical protein
VFKNSATAVAAYEWSGVGHKVIDWIINHRQLTSEIHSNRICGAPRAYREQLIEQ